jgi:aspartyl-tRNA(Asn)/glutamyl-tRNA(Gln) amidotransferase subunit A
MEVFDDSLIGLQRRIHRRELSSTEVVRAYLSRIESVDPKVQAFVYVDAEGALEQATRLDRDLAEGRLRGPLHGVPIGVKDMIDVEGCPTACDSRHRPDAYPVADATAIRRLRNAGALIIGKTHTHEYASGVTTPPTRNPWNLDYIPGGSSGGSGAAVCARECVAALGTDTAGSVRIPAALCGVVGYKPSFGVVPRGGVVPFSWSLDHVGPLARSVEDAAIVTEAMAGYDPMDPGSATGTTWPLASQLRDGVLGKTIGVPLNHFPDRNRSEIDTAVTRSVEALEQSGARVVEVELPDVDLIYPSTLLAIDLTEGAAYHLERLDTAPELFGDDARAILEAGRHISGTTYVNAQRVRRHIQLRWQAVLQGIDALAVPTVPAEAVPIGVTEIAWPDGIIESILDAYVRTNAPASLLGLPAISLPAGVMPNGLPFGVQLIGKPYADAQLLSMAHTLEDALAFPGGIPTGC